MADSQLDLKKIKRVVIKMGSNVLTADQGLRHLFFKQLATQVSYLKSKNIQVVLVSSGAIAAAMSVFQNRKPKNIPEKQAYAAIGQPILMNVYSKEFAKKDLQVAQILMTQSDLSDRTRYLNAKHAIETLIKKNVVPIVNENDTVTVDEIKIGDNDQLSAYVAALIDADLLVLLSHVEGFYNGSPKQASSELIPLIQSIDESIESLVFDGYSERTTGGMTTKLLAARYSLAAGIPMMITSGFQKDCVKRIFKNKFVGTLFLPPHKKMKARKSWIQGVRRSKGRLTVDAGAKKALVQNKKSLLSSGVVSVEGRFEIGDCVDVVSKKGCVLAKGLSSYSSVEISKIIGCKSSEIQKILGYKYGDEVIHRDDMVMEV